jgi:hypothetical protein
MGKEGYGRRSSHVVTTISSKEPPSIIKKHYI